MGVVKQVAEVTHSFPGKGLTIGIARHQIHRVLYPHSTPVNDVRQCVPRVRCANFSVSLLEFFPGKGKCWIFLIFLPAKQFTPS